MKNVALITGITGQDGSYLAEFLLEKGYEVHGLVRRHSISNTARIDHILASSYNNVKFFLHYADMTDSSNLMRLIAEIKPTEVYNLAAQSHVGISFEVPFLMPYLRLQQDHEPQQQYVLHFLYLFL